MKRSEHKPLARWMWASGMMGGQAAWSLALHVWWGAALFVCMSIALAFIYHLEGSYNGD